MLTKGDIVGFVTIEKDREFDIPQEYAGASVTVMVKAGRYPITYAHPMYNHCMFSARLPGVVVSDFFWNRIGAHGSASVNKMVGNEQPHYLNWSPYNIGRSELDLLPGIVLDNVGNYSNGEPMTRLNVETSEGLDPDTLHPEANPYPGSEYLQRF